MHPVGRAVAIQGQLCPPLSTFSIDLVRPVIFVWILGSERGEEEVKGQQGVPAAMNALRWGWLTHSAKFISLSEKGVPLYLLFFPLCSLPPLSLTLVYFITFACTVQSVQTIFYLLCLGFVYDSSFCPTCVRYGLLTVTKMSHQLIVLSPYNLKLQFGASLHLKK